MAALPFPNALGKGLGDGVSFPQSAPQPRSAFTPDSLRDDLYDRIRLVDYLRITEA